jgi:hypothetical protein
MWRADGYSGSGRMDSHRSNVPDVGTGRDLEQATLVGQLFLELLAPRSRQVPFLLSTARLSPRTIRPIGQSSHGRDRRSPIELIGEVDGAADSTSQLVQDLLGGGFWGGGDEQRRAALSSTTRAALSSTCS